MVAVFTVMSTLDQNSSGMMAVFYNHVNLRPEQLRYDGSVYNKVEPSGSIYIHINPRPEQLSYDGSV